MARRRINFDNPAGCVDAVRAACADCVSSRQFHGRGLDWHTGFRWNAPDTTRLRIPRRPAPPVSGATIEVDKIAGAGPVAFRTADGALVTWIVPSGLLATLIACPHRQTSTIRSGLTLQGHYGPNHCSSVTAHAPLPRIGSGSGTRLIRRQNDSPPAPRVSVL